MQQGTVKRGTEGGRTNTYGPFEVVSQTGGEATPIQTLPWQSVIGGQVVVAITDNLLEGAILAQSQSNNFGYACINLEISFWGSISGYDTVLKRQFVRSIYGPARFVARFEDSYDNLIVKGRVFYYGKPAAPSDLVQAQPLSVKTMIYLRPRAG